MGLFIGLLRAAKPTAAAFSVALLAGTVNERLGKLDTLRRIRQPSATKSGIPPSKSGTNNNNNNAANNSSSSSVGSQIPCHTAAPLAAAFSAVSTLVIGLPCHEGVTFSSHD